MTARAPDRGQRGFTIIEMMIAMVLSTLMIGVAFEIGIIVVNGYRQHREAVGVQRAARGSIDLIADSVRNGSAGVPTGDIVDAAACTDMPAMRVTDSATAPDELYVIGAAGGLVTSLRADFEEPSTQIMVLDASGLSAGDLVLVTDLDKGHVVRLAADPVASGAEYRLDLDAIDCPGVDFHYVPGALVLRVKINHFFVTDVDGVPTLMLDDDGDGPDTAEPLAEGIEDLQVAIGVDVDGDGAVTDDTSTTDEWFHNVVGDADPPALSTAPWRALRLTVVARTLAEQVGGEWSARPAVENHAGASTDGYRRRMVSTIVEIRNLEGSP